MTSCSDSSTSRRPSSFGRSLPRACASSGSRPDQRSRIHRPALSRSDELLAAARRSSDPYSMATALHLDSLHYLLARDSPMVAERAKEMLSIAAEHESGSSGSRSSLE